MGISNSKYCCEKNEDYDKLIVKLEQKNIDIGILKENNEKLENELSKTKYELENLKKQSHSEYLTFKNEIIDLTNQKKILCLEVNNLKDNIDKLEDKSKCIIFKNEILELNNEKENLNNEIKELKDNIKELKNDNKKQELNIYLYDYNYNYIKYILLQKNELNIKLENIILKNKEENNKIILKNKEENNKIILKNENKKVKNVINYYEINKEIIVNNILNNTNSIVPDYYEKQIVENVYKILLTSLKTSLLN